MRVVMGYFGFILGKFSVIFKESGYLIRKHKFYLLAPLLLIFSLLAFFVYYVGPAIIVSFIYAGI